MDAHTAISGSELESQGSRTTSQCGCPFVLKTLWVFKTNTRTLMIPRGSDFTDLGRALRIGHF